MGLQKATSAGCVFQGCGRTSGFGAVVLFLLTCCAAGAVSANILALMFPVELANIGERFLVVKVAAGSGIVG